MSTGSKPTTSVTTQPLTTGSYYDGERYTFNGKKTFVFPFLLSFSVGVIS